MRTFNVRLTEINETNVRLNAPLLFSKIINAVTFKLSTRVGSPSSVLLKKCGGNTEGHVTFADIITFSRILRSLDVKAGTF